MAEVYGILAQFDSPTALLAAAEGARDAGYTRWDAHTPFPVHGLERAMGLRSSPVGWFVLLGGLSGAAGGMLLQWWVSTLAYPLVISGKPLFSWPAFVPIMFECGVLGGALGAVLGFLFLARLPHHHHPLFNSERFERVTDDAFFLSIEAADPRFEREATAGLFSRLGAVHVEIVRDGEDE
jgi:Alternative complex III, ActD subunit